MHEFGKQDTIDWDEPEVGAVAWRTFERPADAWQLTYSENLSLLGATRAMGYQCQRCRAGKLYESVSKRLLNLFGI